VISFPHPGPPTRLCLLTQSRSPGPRLKVCLGKTHPSGTWNGAHHPCDPRARRRQLSFFHRVSWRRRLAVQGQGIGSPKLSGWASRDREPVFGGPTRNSQGAKLASLVASSPSSWDHPAGTQAPKPRLFPPPDGLDRIPPSHIFLHSPPALSGSGVPPRRPYHRRSPLHCRPTAHR
jgi:hypothetical protein